MPEGRYFDPATGEPLRRYAKTPEGRIDLFTLPGFHLKTGVKLAPPTPEIIAEYEEQKAAAERQRQEEERLRREKERAQAQERAREETIRKAREQALRRAEEEAHLGQTLAPGRYLFSKPLPKGRMDNLVFALSEIDLAADRTIVHFLVENVGYEPHAAAPWRATRYIRFGLALPNGRTQAYTGIRVKEGALAEDGAGSFSFPPEGRRGAFVMEFPALDPATTTFSILVNDEPLFSGINLRKQPFQTL